MENKLADIYRSDGWDWDGADLGKGLTLFLLQQEPSSDLGSGLLSRSWLLDASLWP